MTNSGGRVSIASNSSILYDLRFGRTEMIKSIFKHLLVFVALVLAISSFNGCGGPSGVYNANTNANANANIANSNSGGNSNGYSSVAGIDYPPLAEGLSNAPFELLDGS